ncbi:MAG: 2-oxoacid:ferredoxin oxidoreductase subunit beta [Chloroflexi bacterium]|nr:MAG: 2-oxoacid:ferredoxin oxidoreductase subunit beta [Chloroflexota bacterium]
MSKRNPEYDFKWCPGCGDFGVVRSIELALADRVMRLKEPIEKTAIIAGIGCSGNLVHLQEGPQPYGFHGIHGRALAIAWGTKAARPDLNVLIVCGDGDFLSIGAEHIGPQAKRNVNITAVVMDNGIYGLTKGQASPTTNLGVVTATTPYGKLEDALRPLDLYMALGVSFVASGLSTRPRDLATLITQAMEHPGFSIVHVQSPCTTYNDTYEALKGNPEKGIEALAHPVPDDHNPADAEAARQLIAMPGMPVGLIYKKADSIAMNERLEEARERIKVRTRSVDDMLTALEV